MLAEILQRLFIYLITGKYPSVNKSLSLKQSIGSNLCSKKNSSNFIKYTILITFCLNRDSGNLSIKKQILSRINFFLIETTLISIVSNDKFTETREIEFLIVSSLNKYSFQSGEVSSQKYLSLFPIDRIKLSAIQFGVRYFDSEFVLCNLPGKESSTISVPQNI